MEWNGMEWRWLAAVAAAARALPAAPHRRAAPLTSWLPSSIVQTGGKKRRERERERARGRRQGRGRARRKGLAEVGWHVARKATEARKAAARPQARVKEQELRRKGHAEGGWRVARKAAARLQGGQRAWQKAAGT